MLAASTPEGGFCGLRPLFGELQIVSTAGGRPRVVLLGRAAAAAAEGQTNPLLRADCLPCGG